MSDIGFTPPPPPPPPSEGSGGMPMAPKRPSETISSAFGTFSQHWQQLLLISLAYVAVFFVVGLIVGLLFGLLGDTLAGATIVTLVSFGLFLVASFALTGALTRLVASEVAGLTTTVSDSLSYGLRKIGPIAIVSILVFVIIVAEMLVGVLVAEAVDAPLWLILVFLGAAFLGFAFSMAVPAVVVEGKRGTEALSRSWQLIMSNFGHALGTLVLAYLVFLAVIIVVGIIGSASEVLQTILSIGMQLVLLPFFSLVVVLLYVNLRVRSGGIARETLQEELRQNE